MGVASEGIAGQGGIATSIVCVTVVSALSVVNPRERTQDGSFFLHERCLKSGSLRGHRYKHKMANAQGEKYSND